MLQLAEGNGVSSVHLNFCTEAEYEFGGALGLMPIIGTAAFIGAAVVLIAAAVYTVRELRVLRVPSGSPPTSRAPEQPT